MKKLVQVQEVEGEGLVALLGQRVLIYCMNYIYAGTLAGVNTNDILLENASIVYDTGAHDAKKFATSEKVSGPLYVRSNSIESYSVTEKQ